MGQPSAAAGCENLLGMSTGSAFCVFDYCWRPNFLFCVRLARCLGPIPRPPFHDDCLAGIQKRPISLSILFQAVSKFAMLDKCTSLSDRSIYCGFLLVMIGLSQDSIVALRFAARQCCPLNGHKLVAGLVGRLETVNCLPGKGTVFGDYKIVRCRCFN